MGEYYSWVNVNKKEYLDPYDFDLGVKLYESAYGRNHLLGALYDLLSSDWKGDAIVFLGDQTNITENDKNPVLRKLSAERQIWGEPGVEMDYVYDTYRCISGLFKASEGIVRDEIERMVKDDDFSANLYGVSKESPYEGLFNRESLFCRYAINHTKKEFFDVEHTRIPHFNPLPILMAFPGCGDGCTGFWLGDQIEVSNERPSVEYKDKSAEYGRDT